MKLLKWTDGRQGSGYLKMPLIMCKWPIPFDCYLIKFPEGSYIDQHTDPVKEGKHFRLNIELKKAGYGGYFLCDTASGGYCKRWWRLTLFRPDISPHSVSEVEGSPRYILSIGWIW